MFGFLRNELGKIKFFLVDLNPLELKCYPFIITLDNVAKAVILLIKYLAELVFQTKKIVNLNDFNLATKANESKKVIRHISCKCKCKFDGKNVIQIRFGIVINVGVSANIQEKMWLKKVIFGILLHLFVKMKTVK